MTDIPDDIPDSIPHTIHDKSQHIETEIKLLRSTIAKVNATAKSSVGGEQVKTRATLVNDSIEDIKKSLFIIASDIEDIWRILDGDGHVEKGLRMDIVEVRRLYASVESVVGRLRGDGSIANPGVFNELTTLVDTTNRRATAEKIIIYVVGGVGLSLISFFWNNITTIISSNGRELENVKTSQADQKGSLKSISTDMEWVKGSLLRHEAESKK